MKKTALLAAAAALVGATPAFAAEGYLGVRAAVGEVETGVLGDDEFEAWQGEVAFGEHNDHFGLQFGAGVGGVSPGGEEDEGIFRADGHAYVLLSPGARLGVGVAMTNAEDSDLKEFVYGVEGSFDLGPNTDLWGSAMLGSVDLFGVDVDTFNGDGGADFYLNPNFRLGGNIGVGNIDDVDVDTFSAGVSAEWQPSSMPLSIYGSYQTFTADGSGGDSESNTFSIGARWNFGGGTLQERNDSLPFRGATSFVGRLFDVGSR